MNCNRYQRLYFLSIDKGLLEKEEKQMQEHLGQCAACQTEIRQNQFIDSQLKEKKTAPSEHLLWNIRRKARERLLKTEPKSFELIPGLSQFLPRLACSAALVAAIAIFLSVLLSTEKQLHVARVETEINSTRPPEKTSVDFEDVERHFRDIYVAEVKMSAQEAFSIIDRAVSLAKMSKDEYCLSFPAVKKNIEETIEDLEKRVKKII